MLRHSDITGFKRRRKQQVIKVARERAEGVPSRRGRRRSGGRAACAGAGATACAAPASAGTRSARHTRRTRTASRPGARPATTDTMSHPHIFRIMLGLPRFCSASGMVLLPSSGKDSIAEADSAGQHPTNCSQQDYHFHVAMLKHE